MATSTIFKTVAATEQGLTVAEQEILTARIDEAVLCYPVLSKA